MALFDLTEDRKPRPHVYTRDDLATLGDHPEKHRWRATWDRSSEGVCGVELHAYPVVRHTPCGVWLDIDAFRSGGQWSLEDYHRHQWVANHSGRSFAKPTRREALESLAIRLSRWANRVRNSAIEVKEAADVMQHLRPDLTVYAERARNTIGSI